MACESFVLLRKDTQTEVDYTVRILAAVDPAVKRHLAPVTQTRRSDIPTLTMALDLGPISIGWAIIDGAHASIVATGVRVFPEGVDRDQQGGEKSKSQTRRDARGTRRQIARRAERKRLLRGLRATATMLLLVPFILTACSSTMPSARVHADVDLPTPQSARVDSAAEVALPISESGVLALSPTSLIRLAFNRQPDISSSFEAFRAEEARYDFFYTSRDALTPHLSLSNTFSESRTLDDDNGKRIGTQNRAHGVEVGVDKLFFDTTRVSVAAGLDTLAEDGDIGNQPFLSANVRYPLGESREKLERASEDIFRQNELNDAQLAYIVQIRRRLERALRGYYQVLELRDRVKSATRWQQDLMSLSRRMDAIEGRDVSNDRRRVEAELARANAEVRNLTGRSRVELARFKHASGIPYDTEVKFVEESFNPFEGRSHEVLLRISIKPIRKSLRFATPCSTPRCSWIWRSVASGMSRYFCRAGVNSVAGARRKATRSGPSPWVWTSAPSTSA